MSSQWRRHPARADVEPGKNRVWSTDDRDGFITNKSKMHWQMEWAGPQMINKRILVHEHNLDEPQEQLRTIVIPQDPAPIMDARPEPYTMDET